MSGGGAASEEKSLPASNKKLRDARKKGQIAHSKEMVTAAVSLAAFGYLLARGAALADQLRDGLASLPAALERPFAQGAGALAGRLLADVLFALVPLIGLLVVVAVLANVAVNGGALLAIDPVLPKMERLDPAAGLKRLFGLKNLLEATKALFKVAVIAGLVVLVTRGGLQALVETPFCGIGCAGAALRALAARLLLGATGVFLVLGVFDIGLQKWLFAREMRMTKSEQKRERKDSDGNPLIRRQHRQDRRVGRTRTGLRNATFLVRSADTVAAMRYAVPDALVPVLVARGTGDRATTMLEEARRLDVPVIFDAAAVATLNTLKVGDLVKQSMFQAVIACMHEARIL